jgi:hypothetical protein
VTDEQRLCINGRLQIPTGTSSGSTFFGSYSGRFAVLTVFL